MTSEATNKRPVDSGVIEFQLASESPIRIVVPVGKTKEREASQMMKELYAVAMKHYRASDYLNPIDLVKCMKQIADAIETHRLTITEDKYYGRNRNSRSRLREGEQHASV